MLNYELNRDRTLKLETPDDGYSHCFSYYDKPSLNRDKSKLLANRLFFDGKPLSAGVKAGIGYFDLMKKEFIKVDETYEWKCQQGSQL